MVSLGAPVRFLHQGKLNRVLKSGSASLLVDPGTEPFVNMRVPEVSVGPLALPSQLCTLFLQAQKWLSSLPILLLLLLLSRFSCVWLWATPWTAAYQAPLSMGSSRQQYWSGCHCLLQVFLSYISLDATHFINENLFLISLTLINRCSDENIDNDI